ncbi:tetratricopeptide repeat protein [Pseudonocardia sp. MH-G8]|uniref:tetratricopeptide repeat protein n=1 Tax=Pseudonocardia sp. MH-G8 TaxID=1854588 RepID=UPI000BA0C523|nr:tetratricopeptide repeat protein [Pseudonocardia sp. MH-G8]OZM76389.1 cytochrome C biosynthesis protein [Pseudonocardia sp. MH-G8]
MTAREVQLRQLADQAVRDIVDLDAQVAAGEITEVDARPLRRRYETTAGRALEALDALDALGTDAEPPLMPRSRPRGWSLAYLLAVVVALVAAVVLLPASLLERPAGGAVTGNEAVQGAAGAPPLDPSATVTDEQLEQVVAANPDVIGMRVALADRYVAQGEYEPAMRHYLDALRREPGNADALARLGWLLLQIDQPEEAMRSVEQALAIDPSLDEALWFKANIELYGVDDPTAALATLQELAGRDLPAEVRAQVDQLTATAEQRRQEGSGQGGTG